MAMPDAEARLDREARMASALNHAGIVAVYDVGRHEERPYVVMELIEGRPLTALLAESRLPLKEAIDLAAQIADALATAHAAGIIHRDLKPQNVMVTAEGRAKVVDFGLSKLAPAQVSGTARDIQGEALTGDYAVLGTAGYMAPEQVMGLPADGPRRSVRARLNALRNADGSQGLPPRHQRADDVGDPGG
jgi:serine/threonine-protein kinase